MFITAFHIEQIYCTPILFVYSMSKQTNPAFKKLTALTIRIHYKKMETIGYYFKKVKIYPKQSSKKDPVK